MARREATGYGLCYFTQAMLKENNDSFEGKRVIISGSGNVAIYACEKATQLKAKVIAMSDSNGVILDEEGIDLVCIEGIERGPPSKNQGISINPSKCRLFRGSSKHSGTFLATSLFHVRQQK